MCMIGINVVRILSAVVLLVQCARCGMTQDEAAVFKLLNSYLEIRKDVDPGACLVTDSLVTVKSHIDVFPQFTLSNVLSGGALTLKDVKKFDIKPSYCPTTTMLACGQADVSDGFCLQLLDRVHDYIKNGTRYLGSDKDAFFDSVLARKFFHKNTGASSKASVRTPIASSRKRRASSIAREYKGRVAEVGTLISTDTGSLEVEYDRLSVEMKAEFERQVEELKKKQEELTVPKEEWVNKKFKARLHQLAESLATLEMLKEFPSDNREEWLSDSFSLHTMRDISTSCYPEQFIACGEHVKSVADGEEKTKALRQCFETIRKYSDFRRLAAKAFDMAFADDASDELDAWLAS